MDTAVNIPISTEITTILKNGWSLSVWPGTESSGYQSHFYIPEERWLLDRCDEVIHEAAKIIDAFGLPRKGEEYQFDLLGHSFYILGNNILFDPKRKWVNVCLRSHYFEK